MGTTSPMARPDYRALFESVPAAYLVLLPDAPTFTIVAASDAYLRTTRTERECVVGRGIFEVFPDPSPETDRPARGATLQESLEHVVRTGRPQRMGDHRYDLRYPDGTIDVRWWTAINSPVLGEGGEVEYIVHQAEDVTERTSRMRFHHLAAVLERLTTANTHEDVFEVVRAGAQRLVGADGAALVLREGAECHYVSTDSLAGPIWMGQRFPMEHCVSGWAMLHGRTAVIADVTRDERVPQEVYASTFINSMVMVPVGTPEAFAAIGTYWAERREPDAEEIAVLEALARVAGDAIQRNRAAAALRASEKRYRTLFDSIDAGFCVIEMLFDEAGRAVDYRFLEVNDAFERQTGLADAVGRRCRELIPNHEEYWFELYGGVVRSGQRVHFDRAAGALDRHYEVDAFPVGEPGQNRVGVLFYDISDRRRAEARLREASRLEAVGELAGGVAHEANNQMSVVLGFADFVLRNPDLPASVRDDVEQMQRAAERTALVTSQLLAFGRRQVLHPAVINVNTIITGLAPVLVRTLGVDGELVLALASDLSSVQADSSQLEQVLLNLAINARDAMRGGGTLTISTDNVVLDGDGNGDEAEAADGEPLSPGSYVRLVVEDTGHGVPPELRARIFDPFFTTKPVGEGTGLGLASVYGIVKQSGGGIQVEGEPGEGARFVIHLPAISEP